MLMLTLQQQQLLLTLFRYLSELGQEWQ